MTSQEHTVAVVEPALDGESTIHFARQTVDRGGRATVVVLIGRETVAGMAAFAKSENLTFPDGREIYMERLANQYSEIFDGKERMTVIVDGRDADRVVFDRATRDEATSVVVPQRLVHRRNWKTAVAKSPVPVLIAPDRAA